MKYIFVALVTLGLTGCGWFERKAAAFTGYSKVCVDGVQYLQFSSGVTPQYNQDGKVVTCK